MTRVSPLRLLEGSVSLPMMAAVVLAALIHQWSSDDWPLAFWAGTVALVELLPVPAWRELRISMSFPLLMAVAFIYSPGLALLVAFVGSVDPREFRGEVDVWRALFNRAQIGLASFVGSLLFHSVTASVQGWWSRAIGGATLAALAAYIVNATLVGLAASFHYRMPFTQVARKLRIGNPAEFLVSYVGLGVVGMLLARLYLATDRGAWAVALFLLPLLLARQMFFRSRALEEATNELRVRGRVLELLSNRMAEERLDERQQVAKYLHDDLSQRLFRLGVHADVARKHLEAGETQQALELLARIRADRDDASETVRGLLRDLHTATLGRTGLSDALHVFTADLESESKARIHVFVDEFELPAPIQLLAYQIAREAILNAVNHGGPTNVWVSLREMPEDLRLEVRDDGKGFDPETEESDGHYGLSIMRERAGLAGGTIRIDSAPGAGAKVTVSLPRSWLAPPESGGEPPAEPGLGLA